MYTAPDARYKAPGTTWYLQSRYLSDMERGMSLKVPVPITWHLTPATGYQEADIFTEHQSPDDPIELD